MEEDLDESSTDNNDQQSIPDHCFLCQQENRNVENDSSPGLMNSLVQVQSGRSWIKLAGRGGKLNGEFEKTCAVTFI